MCILLFSVVLWISSYWLDDIQEKDQKQSAILQALTTNTDKSSIKIKMDMEHWWNDTDRETRKTLWKTCPSASLSTIHLT